MKLNAVTINLSAADIIAMYTTPVTVLAAPGSGKAIVVDRFVFNFDYGTTQFTGGGNITLKYSGGATITSTMANTKVQAASDSIATVGALATEVTVSSNTAVQITNASAAFAAGDGTAKLTVYFSVINV